MSDFKKFAEGYVFAGNREDESKEGAMICFDAWDESDHWTFRIWHYDPDFEINLEGEGYKVLSRERKFHDDLGLDLEDYCTYIKIAPTQDKGWLEVKTPTEHQWDDAKITWGEGKITDLEDNKADMEFDGSNVKITETLTLSEKRYFMMDGRLNRIRRIAEHQGNHSIVQEIIAGRREFMSSAQADDYEAWLDETYGVCPNK